MSHISFFLKDTNAADTIPLKMVFYVAVTACIILITVLSWNNMAPVYSGAQDNRQLNSAATELMSIKSGYARNLNSPNSPPGSMCTIGLSVDGIRYLAFGVDPDPNLTSDLNDSSWAREDNVIICQYETGTKERYYISGTPLEIRKGKLNENGHWSIDHEYYFSKGPGVVIEGPIDGEFNFELVHAEKVYVLSHF